MGVANVLVLCAILWMSSCEVTKNQQDKTTATIINTRFKRESEMDSRMRDNRLTPSVPLGALRKSTASRPLAPVSKPLNPLNLRNHNILPRTYTNPSVHYKQSVPLNTTEENSNESNIKDNDTKAMLDSEINEHENLCEEASSHDNLSALDKHEENNVVKEEEIIQKEAISEATNERIKEIKNDTDTYVLEDSTPITTKELKNPALKSTKDGLTANEAPKHKTEILTKPSDTLVENTDSKLEVTIANEDHETQNDLKNNKTITDSINEVTNNLKTAELSPKLDVRMTHIPILTRNGNVLIPKRVLIQSPIIPILPKTTVIADKPGAGIMEKNKSDDNPVEKCEDKHNNSTSIPDVSLLLKSLKVEPDDEIVIQNNNFEELYESSAPQFFTPKLIASELHPAQNWNHFNQFQNPILPDNKEFKGTQNYDSNIPYSCDISRYPDRYVVNTYYGKNRNYYNHNNTSAPCNYQWNQGSNYYQPKARNFGQGTPNYYYPSNQGYPRNRIWRTWKNNEIVIRPKNSKAIKTDDLYKTINGYLANSRNIPLNKGNIPVFSTGNIPAYNAAGNIPVFNTGNMPAYNAAGNIPVFSTGNMPAYNSAGNIPVFSTGNMPAYNVAGNIPVYGASKVIGVSGNQNISPRSFNDPFQLQRYGY